MPSKYPIFDVNSLKLLPLDQRRHDMQLADVLEIAGREPAFEHPDLPAVADAMAAARQSGAATILLMGAHVIKQGLSRHVIDMIRRGWLSVVAMNGACAIHDYELARIGATTESVAHYIRDGKFGLWTQTGELNDIVTAGNAEDLGFGEAVGKAIAERDLPHKDVSIFAAAYQADVPATVHLGIGYDIIHQHPNFDAAAAGQASYRDFLILTKVMERLEGGVVLCWGTAVMGPEVYLKSLAMVRNAAARKGRKIARFTAAVFDLVQITGDIHAEASKDSPEYYYRPYKTVLVRTVADGGTSFYIRGDHRRAIPALHKLLQSRA